MRLYHGSDQAIYTPQVAIDQHLVFVEAQSVS